MRVKMAKKPPRSIRYLLCADQKLQRISLRRIPERLKKAKQPPRSIRLKNSVGARKSLRFPWEISSRAIALGVICVVASAALITARQPSHRADVASVAAPPEAHAPLEHVPMAARLETKKTVVAEAPATAAAVKSYTADVSMGKTPAVEWVKAPAVESAATPAAVESRATTPAAEATAKTPAVESEPKAAAVESTAKADAQNVAPVTITGCLELDAETFWLKDTSGMDAPKSRSWKSGFLKKRPSRIELVDSTNTLKLSNYVGQRVAATGMLTDREMRARSLQRDAASCN